MQHYTQLCSMGGNCQAGMYFPMLHTCLTSATKHALKAEEWGFLQTHIEEKELRRAGIKGGAGVRVWVKPRHSNSWKAWTGLNDISCSLLVNKEAGTGSMPGRGRPQCSPVSFRAEDKSCEDGLQYPVEGKRTDYWHIF